ncbi:Leukotriene C4 synthase [Turdus rufiventris]|nr:Leukotriene C4 synthase [Turdus rufiventris]
MLEDQFQDGAWSQWHLWDCSKPSFTTQKLEQKGKGSEEVSIVAYFFLQVIYARRLFGISPPKISGPPEFERIFRAQVNSSEYFPIFMALLWQAGLFFHQGLAAALGLLYLYARYCYFMGYKASSSESRHIWTVRTKVFQLGFLVNYNLEKLRNMNYIQSMLQIISEKSIKTGLGLLSMNL